MPKTFEEAIELSKKSNLNLQNNILDEERAYKAKLLTSERLLKDNPAADKATAAILLGVEEEMYDILKGIKSEIKIPNSGKLISEFAEEVSNILASRKNIFYRQDIREVVEINSIKDHNGNIQDTGFIQIKPSRFVTLLEDYITPITYIKVMGGGFEKKVKSISSELASTILQSPQIEKNLPKIRRIFNIPMPIIYKGKLTFPNKGYDYRFDSWLPYSAPTITNPDMSIEDAKKVIYEIYKEFCFQNPQDYINAIAGLLTPFLRGLFKKFNSRTPLFFYIANRERAGKDYCAGITGMLYENCTLEEPPICSVESEKSNANNPEELRKKILSAFISGRKRLHFANNKGYINNSVLEAIITSEKFSDRLLGKNENLTFDNELDFSASGNVGIGFTPDLANRMRIIRLFLDMEDANQRKFEKPNLHWYIKENRGLIISALYSLVRNWVDKGMPKGSLPYASFPEWAEICGGIMESAGYSSPCVQDKETSGISGDTETADMKTLFELCYERFPEQWITKNMIKGVISGEDSIFHYLDFEKKSDQIKFANKLTKFYGRVLSDIQLSIKDISVRASRQELKFTKQKSEKNRDKIFEFGNLGNLGNLNPLSNLNKKRLIDNGIGETLPTLPTLPKIKPFTE